MERRDIMKLLATVPLGAWALSSGDVADAALHTHGVLDELEQTQPARAYTPKFFQPLEWRTVRVLSDIVIPRDAKSGSATEAGVPEFMDFVMVTYTNNQARMRDGLGWLNAESRARFTKSFPDLTAAQRIAIVNDIAWPNKAKPEHQAGVRFFNAFRDLCAGAFFTSRIGVKDIGYMGNVPQVAWKGCPTAANTKAAG
ncbi:MAG: gluconate 2-dehydrogenase subunit 3 family protein [Gemmatimonadaceae bacterium]|nr:gluconate 2-dehydrogenase subunit 3 family protein [Gemmatimonadaceae bacterium]